MNPNWKRSSNFLDSAGESETDETSSDEDSLYDSENEREIQRVLNLIRHNAIVDNSHEINQLDSDISDSEESGRSDDNGYQTEETMSSISSDLEDSEQSDESEVENASDAENIFPSYLGNIGKNAN
jgi:hypothetical protein